MRVTVQSLAARRTEQAAGDLAALVAATPEDRLRWQPLGEGRTILAQILECGAANLKWTHILRSRAYARLPAERVEPFERITTAGEAVARLRETAAELASAILAVPDEALGEEVAARWGPYPLADCCLHAYWNMVYHEGQINYVQTLYGDKEEH